MIGVETTTTKKSMRCSLNQASGFASVSSERRLSASHTPAYTRGVDGEGGEGPGDGVRRLEAMECT